MKLYWNFNGGFGDRSISCCLDYARFRPHLLNDLSKDRFEGSSLSETSWSGILIQRFGGSAFACWLFTSRWRLFPVDWSFWFCGGLGSATTMESTDSSADWLWSPERSRWGLGWPPCSCFNRYLSSLATVSRINYLKTRSEGGGSLLTSNTLVCI